MSNYWNYNNPYGVNPYSQAQYLQQQYQAAQQAAQAQMPQQQPQSQSMQLFYTNGVEGAKAFPVPPNGTVRLMDSDNPYIYIKTADAEGKATLKRYKLIEDDITDKPAAEFNPAEFVTKKELSELLQGLQQSNAKESIIIQKPQEDTSNG